MFGSALFDTIQMPGDIDDSTGRRSGYVLTGDLAVFVVDDQRAVVRRILASVRLPGEPTPPVASWARVAAQDESDAPDLPAVTAEVPAGADVSVTLSALFPDCATGRDAAYRRPGGEWGASLCRDRIVRVTAPTRALADVVAASVRGY